MRHGGRALLRHPLVVGSAVPRGVRAGPVVRRVLEELQTQMGGIGTEGQHVAIGILGVRLMKDAFTGGKLDRSRVSEAAHAAQGAKVVIERTVLLHHEDNVLDVIDGAGAVIRRKRKSAADRCGKSSSSCRGGQ